MPGTIPGLVEHRAVGAEAEDGPRYVTAAERVAVMGARNVVAATELGVALISASRVQEAKLQFQRALQIDPSFTDARYDLASAEAAAEEWETAAAEFERVLTERPADTMARQHLGEVLTLWGDQLAGAGNVGVLGYRRGRESNCMSSNNR
jgi:thioredoxin-like negative regulator of GroEL